ncbi:MAG: DUF4013 domain-containing protein [Chloroflexi bacterium]|nr:DUF4013 domain-containing protein [Chloroflexota bacterium]
MDFGKAFSYPFEDQDWFKKIGVAALIVLIPIMGPLLIAGWGFEITRRVIKADPEPLPDWSEFGEMLGNGFKVAVVWFAYMLPVILLQVCLQVAILGSAESLDNDALTAGITFFIFCISCLVFIYSLIMAFIVPAALGNMAAKNDLSAAFRFGEVWGLVRTQPGAYAMVLLGGLVAGFVASLGVVACFIGVFFTAAYATTINAHLRGQAYLQAAPGTSTIDATEIMPSDF